MKPKLKLGFIDIHDHVASFFYSVLANRYDIEIDHSNPEFLIFADRNFGDQNRRYSRDKVTKIFYTGENQRPSAYECDYAISFDYNDSPWHYRLPLFVIYMWALENIHKTSYKYDYILKPEVKEKNAFCSFVVSNPRSKDRIRFYEMLSKYKKIDSGGRHLNNIGGALEGEQAKVDFLSSRKFNIAFESMSHPGYVTEKILHAFYAGTVPIYWGDTKVHNDFNPDSFINVHDFPSFEEAIEYVKEVDNNPDLYQGILNEPKFRKIPTYLDLNVFLDWFDSTVYKKVNKRNEDTIIYF
jgi:hypothetical protein